MPITKISPIKGQSNGGYPVVITGIDPTDHDCIVGEITTPGKGTTKGRWNLGGTMRDGVPECNIDTRQGALAGAAEEARRQGAK